MASQNVKAHSFRSVIDGPALPIIDHLKACPAVELHHMARRAVIGFRGPVISHRKAGRNLIDGLHREVIDLIKAQLLGFVLLVHAQPLPCWMPAPPSLCSTRAQFLRTSVLRVKSSPYGAGKEPGSHPGGRALLFVARREPSFSRLCPLSLRPKPPDRWPVPS